MELDEARARIAELRKTIDYHSNLYYNLDAPTLSMMH